MSLLGPLRSLALSNERGLTIIENLVAVSLVAAVLAASTRFVMLSMEANSSTRSYAALAAQAQKILDSYRTAGYSQLLGKFGTSHGSITNGQTVTEESSYKNGWADFKTTLTAIKTSNTGTPEAVKVQIQAVQRRGRLGDTTHIFETYIARMR